MPQMGVSVSEGTVTRWLKQPGEHVARDEALLEISTDKVDTEVPSPGEGILSQVLVQEGQTVEVGTLLAVIAPVGAVPAETEIAPEEPEAPAAEPVSARGRCRRSRCFCAASSPSRATDGQRTNLHLAGGLADRRRARGRSERDRGNGPGRTRDEARHPVLHRIGRRRCRHPHQQAPPPVEAAAPAAPPAPAAPAPAPVPPATAPVAAAAPPPPPAPAPARGSPCSR